MPLAIPIPQVKFGKRKERSQMCEIFTEDGRIVDTELDVLHGSIQNTKLTTQDAFIISAENQFYDMEDGTWKQQINELSAAPICMIKTLDDVEKRADEIFKNARISAQTEKLKEAARQWLWEKLTWVISIVCGTFIIIAAMQYFEGG